VPTYPLFNVVATAIGSKHLTARWESLAGIAVQEAKKSEAMGTSDVLLAVGAVLFLIQLLVLVFLYNMQAHILVLGAGWILMVPSFLLMTLSMASLDRVGKANGDGTSQPRLVETGLYGVVRHPFYLGWALMAVSIALVSQLWLSIVLMLLQLVVVWWAVREEESLNLGAFKDSYASYQVRVPAMNLFQGAYRKYRSRRGFTEEAALPQD
jgi:protein-S-isoprenylcysteine O-methyltransferase Ste14